MRVVMTSVVALLFATASAAPEYSVSSERPLNDSPIEAGAIDPPRIQCDAPFGEDTIYALDGSDALWIVQNDLKRISSMSASDIVRFKADRNAALARVEQMRDKLLAAPEIDPEFKKRLVGLSAPNPEIDMPLLRAPSEPTEGALADLNFTRLNSALRRARQVIAMHGLSNTFLYSVTTCSYDLSTHPRTIKNSRTGETLNLRAAAETDSIEPSAWTAYKRVSLYELLENFGHVLAPEAGAPR